MGKDKQNNLNFHNLINATVGDKNGRNEIDINLGKNSSRLKFNGINRGNKINNKIQIPRLVFVQK